MKLFVMAGGGSGGHVVPCIAVAGELKARGHEVLFIGTRRGLESKLVPAAGFPIEWIEIGGLNRVGLAQTAKTLLQLPASFFRCVSLLSRHAASAVFSMGGYVAGPVMIASWSKRIPTVLMEPNAMPGLVSRTMGKLVDKALISFDAARRYFPPGITEITGLPVREAFFRIGPKPAGAPFTVLVTGGSQGSQALNSACRDAWPALRASTPGLRFILQCGRSASQDLARDFSASGLDGQVTAFIEDMPSAFESADLIISRSGAGTVSEIAAAGRPSVLVPFPFSADDHQRHNAEAMQQAGGAILIPQGELTGDRLAKTIQNLERDRDMLKSMGESARSFARRGAAQRAATLLEELAGVT